MLTNFSSLTLGDLCKEALFEAGIVGQGMTPGKDAITRAWSRAQFILQQWERKRWMIWALQSKVIASNGAQSYTVGAGGDFNLGVTDFNPDFGGDFGSSLPVNRPARLEGAFFRQQQGYAGAPLAGGQTQQVQLPGDLSGDFNQDLSQPSTATVTLSSPSFIDYPLQMIEAGEDYWTKVRLKGLLAWPQWAYYEAGWPLGTLYLYPAVPQGYFVGIVVRDLLPVNNASLATVLAMPPEYHSALLYSTAMAVRSAYQVPSFPGDILPTREREALKIIAKSNTRVPRSVIGREWQGRGGRYNIFSDQSG